MDDASKIHYFRKIEIKFKNGISVEITSKAQKEGKPESGKVEIDEKNKEFYEFFVPLKENYGVEKIEGEKENGDEARAISIVLYPEAEKKKENGAIKIFDRSSIKFTEIASYDVIAKIENKEKEIEIILSEEKETKNFISYFAGEKNYCSINFNGHTFFGNIIIKGEDISARIPLLVYPAKLKPEEAEKILSELLMEQEEIVKSSPTGIFSTPGEKINKTPLQTLIIINSLFSENRKNGIPLGKTFRAIAHSPDKIIVKEKVKREPHEVTAIDEEVILEGIISGNIRRAHNYQFLWNNKGYSFTSLLNEEAKISYDTYSNRFIKYFLEFLRNTINLCCERVRKNHERVKDDFVENLINRVQFYNVKYIIPLLNLEWMSEVSKITHLPPPPQKLLKDPFYSSAFFDYLTLIRNLKITDEEFEKYLHNPVTYMPELYEMWCGLKLKKIAEEIGAEPKSQPYYTAYSKEKKNDENWFSYSLPLKPDFSLTKNEKLILLDSKYRVDFIEEWEKELDEELLKEEKRGTFKLGDLYKMHTYREAIRKKQKDEKDREGKKPLWVIALYPGDKIALFTKSGEKIEGILSPECQITISLKDGNKIKLNKWEKREELKKIIKAGGVGAIPFRPEFFEDEETKEILKDIFEALF
jgi:predicted component of viral defense system (DUF524 family)